MNNKSTLVACTIISKNYLSYARTFTDSFLAHHPDSRVYLLLVDQLHDYFDPAQEKFHLVDIAQLNIPNLPRFCFQYGILELNTAVKPYFLSYLFRTYGFSQLAYFDPDILINQELSQLSALLRHHSIALTPHLTAPINDNYRLSELDILLAGTYNLGFIGLASTPITQAFLTWWQNKLYTGCQIAHGEGMFVDQRWVDLAPGLFGDTYILRDPGYNVAYWNLHSRSIDFDRKHISVNGRACYFFHFSGFNPDNLSIVSKHQNRFSMKRLGKAAELFRYYRDLLFHNGYQESKQWPYAFGYFSDGVTIPEVARQVYRKLGDEFQKFGDPFKAQGDDTFFHWLQQPMSHDTRPELTRFWYEIYQRRPDLQHAYPNALNGDKQNFLEWIMANGLQEYKVGDPFVPRPQAIRVSGCPIPGEGIDGIQEKGKPMKTSRETVGVNLAGYFESEKGVAEAARSSVRALQAASIPYVLNNIRDPGSSNCQESIGCFTNDNQYPINLVHINADQVPAFAAQWGPAYFRGKYNIGFWFWELSQFPEQWQGAFQFFNEVWVASNFVLDAVSRVSPCNVVKIPLSLPAEFLEIRSEALDERSRFDLPPESFIFLFIFDFHSFVERKNPLGLIEAFKKAFSSKDDACLVLKTVHSETNDEDVEAVKAAAVGANVKIIDGIFTRTELKTLLETCDCYVSLHRSEGFGLTIAEAMALGKPVIVTAYSANMDFTTPSNSFLVKYRLVPLEFDHGPYKEGNSWAEPDLDHAAELMRFVYENRSAGQMVGKQGRTDIRHMLAPRVVGEQILDRLQHILLARRNGSARRSDPIHAPEYTSMESDAITLHARSDIYNIPLTSNRGFLGQPIVLAKKLLRRLLAPFLAHQVAYNATNARVVNDLMQKVQTILESQNVHALRTKRQLNEHALEMERQLDEHALEMKRQLDRLRQERDGVIDQR